jgi:hypothetical protein
MIHDSVWRSHQNSGTRQIEREIMNYWTDPICHACQFATPIGLPYRIAVENAGDYGRCDQTRRRQAG